MISIRRLTKRYGATAAVDDLSLEVRDGEIFGFLGPNGAGKTTTIKIAAGLLSPTSGTVEVGGVDLRSDPQGAKRLLGYVPDRPYLYEKLTGSEFLSFVAGLHSLDRDGEGWQRRAGELLERFGLEDVRNALVESYSHGMRQKLVLVGALLHEPRVLVLDEPLVGLDPKSARTLKDVFRERAASGVTVFLSTHILEIAEKMCERVAIIDRGRLVCVEEVGALTKRLRGDLEQVFLKLTSEASAP